MAASFPLDFQWLASRVKIGGSITSDALQSLRAAGLIDEPYGRNTSYWSMTDEGRSLLCTRPPHNCYRAIRDALASSGPMTARELETECRNQASDYSPREFMLTLWDMIHSCLVIDVTESGDAHSSYDLPEHTE